MNDRTFDAFARRAAITRDRRTAIAILAGAMLATSTHPLGSYANGGRDGKGGGKKHKQKAKGEAKQCRKQAKVCVIFWREYCILRYFPDYEAFQHCQTLYWDCCHHYHECEEHAGDACIHGVPY